MPPLLLTPPPSLRDCGLCSGLRLWCVCDEGSGAWYGGKKLFAVLPIEVPLLCLVRPLCLHTQTFNVWVYFVLGKEQSVGYLRTEDSLHLSAVRDTQKHETSIKQENRNKAKTKTGGEEEKGCEGRNRSQPRNFNSLGKQWTEGWEGEKGGGGYYEQKNPKQSCVPVGARWKKISDLIKTFTVLHVVNGVLSANVACC